MEEDIPIDIQTGKLVDWLISRRHVKKNWPEAILNVREKINNAIQDMPEHPEIIKLLSGAYINYFHCLKIIDILSETEKESKNIFGWYTSQRMKDWQTVVRLYETDNIYLAEASQYLIRNVNYEIPSLKKQIAKLRQIHEDSEKKIQESTKGASVEKEKYFSACKQIGIIGDNVKEELIGLLNNLPEKLTAIGEKTKDLKKAQKFYEDYIHFIISPNRTCLPLLNFIIDHGDVTIYEWKYGEPPMSIDKETVTYPKTPESAIDFGSSENTADEIDFGDVELETGEIDWGIIDEQDATINQIDFGDDLSSDVAEIVVESSGVEGGVARGQEALTLLQNEATRNQFINELLELEGFLRQRLVELEMEENILSLSLFSNSPKSLQYQNATSIQSHIGVLISVLNELTSMKMKHLFMISSSPRYVDRLAHNLEIHLRNSDRLLASIDAIRKKGEEASRQLHLISGHLKLLVERSRELQDNVESEISKKYKNRPVNLMGGITYM